MQIINSLCDVNDSMKNCCLTIGNFDGVHLGHQAIIKATAQKAKELNTKTVIMTFEPHPAVILHPEKQPQVLTPLPLKIQLLKEMNVDLLIVVKDSYKMLTLSPENFIKEFLMQTLKPKAIVEGDDFHFGYGRSGNVETLKKFGQTNSFETVVVAAATENNNQKISSTMIRRLLQKGNVDNAAKAIGRKYRLMGLVVSGRGKGAQLGFPTANIDPCNQIIPAEGVYAGYVTVKNNIEKLCQDKANIPAVFSLGRAKTFVSNHPLLIEAHILDENTHNIYGKYLAMDFKKHIRGQERFQNAEQLKKQIDIDCRKAGEILT